MLEYGIMDGGATLQTCDATPNSSSQETLLPGQTHIADQDTHADIDARVKYGVLLHAHTGVLTQHKPLRLTNHLRLPPHTSGTRVDACTPAVYGCINTLQSNKQEANMIE